MCTLQFYHDDVDILVFICMHSYVPITTALALAHCIDQRNAVDEHIIGNVAKLKSQLFRTIARRLTDRIPLGDEYSSERVALLGEAGGHPLLIALRFNDVEFVAQDACQEFVNDVWGRGELASKRLLQFVKRPYKTIPSSLQLRWTLFVLSRIAYASLIWVAGLEVQGCSRTPAGCQSMGFGEVMLYAFAFSKALAEMRECPCRPPL